MTNKDTYSIYDNQFRGALKTNANFSRRDEKKYKKDI